MEPGDLELGWVIQIGVNGGFIMNDRVGCMLSWVVQV